MRLRQDIADNRAANENSKTQINELQNEIVSKILFSQLFVLLYLLYADLRMNCSLFNL